MKLLSRFRKGKKNDAADSQAVAGPDAGLLMPTALAQPSADSGEKPEANIDATLATAESGDGDSEGSAVSAEDDDLLGAAQSDSDAEGESESEGDVDDLMAAAQDPPAADEIKPEEPAEADADDDDPLSAFKIDEVHSELADMTKDIEEIAIADLVEQVRDVRGMLPAAPAEDEDAA